MGRAHDPRIDRDRDTPADPLDHPFLEEAQQFDLERERNEILTKTSQKLKQVIDKLAEEKGLDIVVDAASTVFFKPALDITKEATAAYDKANPVK